MQSRREILHYWECAFDHAKVDSPRLSAQVLLAHVLGMDRLGMLLTLQSTVSRADQERMRDLASRRLQGEPVAYLIGKKEFYGLDFRVGAGVLIPRPETELMIDHLIAAFGRHEQLTVLDVGTGSGILAVSCARLFPRFRVVASDLSLAALRIALANAHDHHVQDRILFVQADLVTAHRVGHFEVILANLPYVPDSRRQTMSLEVLGYEAEQALFAGQDGMACYRKLAKSLVGNVSPGTLLLCEIDHTQGPAMVDLFGSCAHNVQIIKDLSDNDRLAVVAF
jgi:release factor glutamine methyltransferase